MEFYDVFNGDADGICALHQLRLSVPRPDATLITGVKRDIKLLAQIDTIQNCSITVLDISLDRNRDSLIQLLAQENSVQYIDHHFSGQVPDSKRLEVHIDPQPTTCTSVIVDSLLQGKHRKWSIVGAFGDNLDETATHLSGTLGLDGENIDILKEIGILLNYNGYGATLDDLFFHPEELYRQVHSFEDPFDFFSQSLALKKLRIGYEDDMSKARKSEPLFENSQGRIFELEGQSWSRRVAGVFSNTLARERPEMAHSLIIPNDDSTLRISVRAPLLDRFGADELCRQFPTGGGRAAAAGINNLPPDQKDLFLDAFIKQFSRNLDQ